MRGGWRRWEQGRSGRRRGKEIGRKAEIAGGWGVCEWRRGEGVVEGGVRSTGRGVRERGALMPDVCLSGAESGVSGAER